MKLFPTQNIILAILILIISSPSTASVFAERPEVKTFIQQMVDKHGFEKAKLTKLFQQFETSEEIIKKISHPYEEKPWHHYRKVFVTKKRILEGVRFWEKYEYSLKKAKKDFGVPPEIIVAILGAETFYGKTKGEYPVLQALSTLAFDYPKRGAFFLSELEQYLLLTREQRLPADKIKGSYAGAMGWPQFIASSYRNFAIDFAKVGKIDLMNNAQNAIGSVANYFKINGWQPNQPIAYKAIIRGKKYKQLKLAGQQNPKPTLSLYTLKKYNILPSNSKINDLSTQVSLMELDAGKNKEYWLGRNNFYVITRYNHSTNYAMAVYELSQQIAKEYHKKARKH